MILQGMCILRKICIWKFRFEILFIRIDEIVETYLVNLIRLIFVSLGYFFRRKLEESFKIIARSDFPKRFIEYIFLIFHL